MIRIFNRALAGLLCFVACSGGAAEQGESATGASLRMLGLEARLDASVGDAHLQKIAEVITTMTPDAVHDIQGDVQYALMLACDPEIYDTLSPETIEAVDNSLESLFDLAKIDRDNHWEPLIYAYGYFNRDVTPESVREVIAIWDALSDEEKAPRYPTYVHVIDAVCKPVSMGSIHDRETTGLLLELVIGTLKRDFIQPPKPGTAFHPPSHACLVLGPLYERWAGDAEQGPLVTKMLGSRAEFEAFLSSQLPGAHDAELSDLAFGYYAYIGSYLANSLARLDARSAVPALARSLGIYQARQEKSRAIDYTRQALLTLGDPATRAAFEEQLTQSEKRDACIKTLVWLARNAQGEGQRYAEEKLGVLLDCEPEAALNTYFKREIDALKK